MVVAFASHQPVALGGAAVGVVAVCAKRCVEDVVTYAAIENVDAVAADQGVAVVVGILAGIETDAARPTEQVVVTGVAFDVVIAGGAEGDVIVAAKNEPVVQVAGADP
ncbi:MAG: hypothetical protein B7Y40_03415 [Gammaproteobacteria bacterium 28-57-27]|nr:MAG: hypothetical protein B7Y40_03415 [Gammaproteobacteria bacterium 28-57-27]